MRTWRDDEIVSTLTTKISFVETSQAARTWWRDNTSGRDRAADRLRRLVLEGYLIALKLRVHPELQLERPIISWQPGEVAPSFGPVSYRLRARWSEPLRWVTAYAASKRTGRVFAGNGGGPSRPLQATHDLHVSAIYLRLLRESPGEARRWVSDNVLAPLRRGKKLPDAELHDPEGRTLKVIEFGGNYPPERVRKVHEDCERRGLPYELW